jgi:hypothetical protein
VAAHVYTLAYIFLSADHVLLVLKWDHIMMAVASLAWCLWNVFEMRRLGYITTAEALRVAAAVAASLMLVWPGAIYAGTWYWRENKMAGTSRMEVPEGKKEC